MKKTIKQHILTYLNDRDWTSSTQLDKAVADIAKVKEATVSRECRELAELGKINKDMRSKVVWYKIGDSAKKKRQIAERIDEYTVRVTYA